MKQILKLTIILSLFAQVCHAQKVETEEEYRAVYDSIVSVLKVAQKDINRCVGRPFSDLVKHFEKYGVKIILSSINRYDDQRLSPQHVYGIELWFISNEIQNLKFQYDLFTPKVYVYFEGSKPYEKALSLYNEHEGNFTDEVEAFYSDAIIKSIKFGFMDGNIYHSIERRRLPLSKEEAKLIEVE